MDLLTLLLVLYLILSHWIADFVFQDEEWALNKKHNNVALLKHVFTYNLIMMLMFFNILSLKFLFLFGVGSIVSHFIIDYFTSKLVGKRFADKYLGGSIPNLGAFSMIGLDQVLHYITMLFLLYYLY